MLFSPLQQQQADIRRGKKQKIKSLKLVEQGDKPVLSTEISVKVSVLERDEETHSLCCPLLVRSAGALIRRRSQHHVLQLLKNMKASRVRSVCSWDLLS